MTRYWAALALKPGHQGIATDAIVPISRMAELIVGAKEDIVRLRPDGADRGACWATATSIP